MVDITDLVTFDEFITHWAADRPDRIAMREEDRVFSYAELEERTARVATALAEAGLQKGDRIAWIGKNSDLYFTLFFGAARAGIVMAPIGWRLSPTEWAFIVNDTKAKIVFTGPGFDAVADQLAGKLDHGPRIGGADATRALIDATPRGAFMPSGPDDAVLQLYTSGTTGHPKGAVLSNRNLFALRKNSADLDLPYTKWEDDEAVLVAMPCAHIGGTGLGIMALAAGLPGVILAEFNPEGVFDAVEQHGVTRFFIVPAALQMLLMHPRCASVDYSRLKYILYGAAPIPLELLRQCIRMFGAEFIQAYGMTETTGTICMLPPEDHDPEGNERMRSAGKPLPGVEIRIVGADGRDVSTGEVGEVVTRSSNNMLGYWNLPEATAKTMTDDGWIHTGDAGYMDADGYLYIHDRVKDMIISGGENVYPAEVESAIYGHPAVQEVAVIGVPDAKWGETVKAVCVPKPGMTIDEADVIAWARERIAAFKAPRSIDVIEALPRNASGKILRKDLRAPYWEGYERMVN
ncbi:MULTISPECIES: fatty acid--CoA ligase [Sphingopyxis]|uniref:fatty acid--CoA ligase n=1 Tax=Sphingopyxis TaxID=165697 RepID=UPI00086C033D|nr:MULTISPECIES: fatty acid--CoA ligase [Sphingopyxis]AVA13167.1 acyl-CoA synthetase [Sphingopyxis sp. MG]ODU27663.1 MAG: acyl-CoA synthetase [Sphingopyxis sp. SCN 67-31]QUM71859.1 fatty acid--CoA ligase [Sphingopyxis granuli]